MLFYYFATQNSEVDYMETNVVFNWIDWFHNVNFTPTDLFQ